jgi:septum formation protein
MDLILASTSPYRQQLLARLRFPFRCVAPGTDEVHSPGEAPAAMAQRLALAKAHSVAASQPQALVIGSDQVAAIDGIPMGKPGDHPTAHAQLAASAGRAVHFHTAVAIVCHASKLERFHVELFIAHFRRLHDRAIENYLRLEQPYDCAGSFKYEGLGIALFERLEGRDPTSLEGLPLIALTGLLAGAGIDVLGSD